MNDILVFFVPSDLKYTFNDVIDELSSTYCSIDEWFIYSQNENGWWYSVNITWDSNMDNTVSMNNTISNLQSALFIGNAYIYVGHKVSLNKTVYHDVSLFCPRIYEYTNLYSQHMNLLKMHDDMNQVLTDLDRDNITIKENLEKMKHKKSKRDKKYRALKKKSKNFEREVQRLNERNKELFDRYPQHC